MRRLPLAIVLTLALQAVPSEPAGLLAAPAKNRIAGEAFYRERVALSPRAVFEAALEEVSRAGAPARVVAEVRLGRPGQVPIDFTLRYDSRRIERRRTYQIRATIRERGRIRFTGTRAWSPAARDRGAVRVLMRMVSADDRDRGDRDDRGPGRRPGGVRGELTGTRWVPIVIADRVVAAPPRQPEPWIVLEAATGRASGSGGCNRFTGGYQAGRDYLRIDELVSTRMACADMSVENAFFQALRRTRDYRIQGRTLELFDDRDRLLARLEERNLR